ncbi:MAG TPA: hypothetical protein VLZ06_05020 [Solirubrobacteraceae bacterium]|nr:hypothetical protein [Solirubrobacteraceae bacterium]
MRPASAIILWVALASAAFATVTAPARADETEQPRWRLEQPLLPGASWPVPLGSVGDIEFLEPNRGLLITGGKKPSVEPGIWAYDGAGWHELSDQCGAEREGRIAWAGPDEFWTVSDGRPGQAAEGAGTSEERPVPLNGNTLCHFAAGQIVASYAHPAFEVDSYQQMRGAVCLKPTDCWFGGEPLPEPQIGAFQLHWNGSALEAEPYTGEGFPVRDMLAFDGHIYQSVRVEIPPDRTEHSEAITIPVLHLINPPGAIPAFEPEDEAGAGLPFYAEEELPQDLDAFHLSAADGVLWAAAGPLHSAGQLTVAVREEGRWRLLIGPPSQGGHQLEHILAPEYRAEEQALVGSSPSQARVTALAAEPGDGSVWIGLEHAESQDQAVLLHLGAQGEELSAQILPTAQERAEGVGDDGAVAGLACPQPGDCWMATSKGWLYHLARASERTLPRNGDPAFEHLISYRPPDLGLPQVAQDAPPADISGFHEQGIAEIGSIAETKAAPESMVTLPLLSHVHSKLLKGSKLQLSFHLSVKARVKLLAQRKKEVVAATAAHTFAAGNRRLLLQLNRNRWPTKLRLKTKALQPLRRVSSVTGEGSTVSTETTGLFVSPLRASGEPRGLLP